MKKILVPCDFSDQATESFRFAFDIAQSSGGEITLLNVIELPPLYDTTLMPSLNFEETLYKDLKADAEKKLTQLKSKWAKPPVKVSCEVAYGSVTETILEYAGSKKRDLIVMGTKGSSGLKEYFAGSNTEKIVRRSPVPVMAVKKYVKLSAIRNIVFPNYLGKDQEALTLKVKSLQAFFDAHIHIVYINTPAEFRRDTATKKELKAFASRFMFKNVSIHVYNDIDQEDGVIHFAHEIGADMIAMGTHGRRGLNHLMTGSVAEDIVNHIDCPIWTCVEKK